MHAQVDELWNVIALGFDGPEATTIDGLQHMFGIDREAALRLARSTPRAVKHDVSRAMAEQYGHALAAIGGRFELQPSNHAFMETSAGEHVSPVMVDYAGAGMSEQADPTMAAQPRRALHAIVPDRLESPDAIGSEHVLGEELESGLEIDVERAQRTVELGTVDLRREPIVIARAGMSSRPPAPSQSLPPPRAIYGNALPTPQETSRTPAFVLIGIGVALIVAAIVTREFWVGELSIGAPILKGVGALLAARGGWSLLSK